MKTLFEVETEPAAVDLPPLRGSELHRPWATEIRARKLAACEEFLRQWRLLIERYQDSGRDDAADREREGYREALDALSALQTQQKSTWWIDRRQNEAHELLLGAEPKPGR